MKKSKKNKGHTPEEHKDLLKRIDTLATRLPWIAVIVVLVSMILILLEVYFKQQG